MRVVVAEGKVALGATAAPAAPATRAPRPAPAARSSSSSAVLGICSRGLPLAVTAEIRSAGNPAASKSSTACRTCSGVVNVPVTAIVVSSCSGCPHPQDAAGRGAAGDSVRWAEIERVQLSLRKETGVTVQAGAYGVEIEEIVVRY